MPQKFEKQAQSKPATWEEVVEAFASGDLPGAAEILRRLGEVGPAELGVLADLMTESPNNSAIAKLFPYRLKLSKRGRGRPTDYFKKQVDDAQIVRAVARARAKHGQLEAAIEEVKSRSKLSRTRIFKALASKNKTKITKSQ